jgi:hypothetical protein
VAGRQTEEGKDGMSNDHWAERNRQRKARKEAKEAAERRLEELREAWRLRRADEEEGKNAGPRRRRMK